MGTPSPVKKIYPRISYTKRLRIVFSCHQRYIGFIAYKVRKRTSQTRVINGTRLLEEELEWHAHAVLMENVKSLGGELASISQRFTLEGQYAYTPGKRNFFIK